MYVIHIKLLNGERYIEYANTTLEMAKKADEYGGKFSEFKAIPIRTKDIRQGREAKKIQGEQPSSQLASEAL